MAKFLTIIQRRLTLALIANFALFAAGATMLMYSDSILGRVLGLLLALLAWGHLASLIVRYKGGAKGVRSLRFLFGPSVHDLTRSEKTVTNAISQTSRQLSNEVYDARKKTSRHEYHIHQALNRIEDAAKRALVTMDDSEQASVEREVDILFVTSNGAGIGHLTRLIAVANELRESASIEFLTLSKAYQKAADCGYVVTYYPSAEAAEQIHAEWNRRFAQFFSNYTRRVRPKIVVFDGTWVYEGIRDVCRARSIRLVWMQRGCWLPEADRSSVQRHSAANWADAIIMPGDYAVDEEIDAGPGVEVNEVPPIVLTRKAAVRDRSGACAELGLSEENKNVLIGLGSDALGSNRTTLRHIIDAVAALGPNWQPIVLASPLLAESYQDSRAKIVSVYPVMEYVSAFEFVVLAAGYNSVNEAIALGVPAIFVPNENTRTDDQVRRATGAARKGLAVAASTFDEVFAGVERLGNTGHREALKARLQSVPLPGGAEAAAELLQGYLTQEDWEKESITCHPD